jgi:hypothetical protein
MLGLMILSLMPDEEWMEQYEENMRANKIIKDETLKCLHETTELNEW